MNLPHSDALVFFGATGDLYTRRFSPPCMRWNGGANHLHGDSEMNAYERLLGDAMAGDGTLFAGQDGVEAAWAVVQPIWGKVTPVHIYEPDTWGPPEAEKLTVGISGCPNSVWRSPHGKTL